MARIPYPEFDRDFRMPTHIYGDPQDSTLLNVFRVLGHSPGLLTAVANIGFAQLTGGELSDFERELVILASSQCFGSTYVWAQHERLAARFGVSREQLAALRSGDFAAPCFDGPQRDLLAFVADVATHTRAGDESLEPVRRDRGDRRLVEIIGLVGVYFLVSRVTTTLDIEIDRRELDGALSAVGHQAAGPLPG
ncbi:carboxymuconolactone decarboxylase family protein [Streptomyces luteoverticillatus]|uniref:Carboxymuconolactone decarboxylase family protein n=1 Tax=Streptomyces luteoverticillatus TaxID=66425 RepID=A0A3S9PQ36_STRLT|nr:carboxymuconolactone decarboxylase family protein [Streptomyces luteoverticillatus]AZQ74437.1 carboxymuconolactone decarboxylase family protein [Streptomyces luteoverticillatus]